MADNKKKRGPKYKKLHNLETKKSFPDKIKYISGLFTVLEAFHSFEGLSFGGKIKNSEHKLKEVLLS